MPFLQKKRTRFLSFSEPNFRAGIQLLFWSLLVGALVLLSYLTPAPPGFRWRIGWIFVAAVGTVTTNVYWFFPRYIQHQKLQRYLFEYVAFCLLFLSGTLLAEFLIMPVLPLSLDLPPGSPTYKRMKTLGIFPQVFLRTVFLSSAVLGTILLETLNLQGLMEQKRAHSRAEKVAMEIRYLKSQVNPHFLFNALNNIYGLARIGDASTPEVVLKLADMLKYSLYNTEEARIPLQEEVEYLKHFIAFQQLKEEGDMSVSITLDIQDEPLSIPPMLLLPLVENAFKHGNPEDLEEGWIMIKLMACKGRIVFEITNTVSSDPPKPLRTSGQGIGLVNVQRQLALHYPEQHTFKISRTSTTHSVHISLLSGE